MPAALLLQVPVVFFSLLRKGTPTSVLIDLLHALGLPSNS